MKQIKLSAFLVVRNEEKNIERALKSLDFCDEIIIVDQQSTDNTIKIAKKYTDKIYTDKCWGYADPSRELAASKCKGEWVLCMDADEEIIPELKEEILESIKSDDYDAYLIHRIVFFINKPLKYINRGDYVLRLHKKNAVNYTAQIHVCIIPKKDIKIKKLMNSMNHFSFTSYKQLSERMHRYTEIQAKTDKKYNSFPRKYFGIFYTPLFYFVYDYLYNLGFLDGKEGLIWAIFGFYYQLLIYKNIWFKKSDFTRFNNV